MKRLMVLALAAVALVGCGKRDVHRSEKKDDAVITITQDNRTYDQLTTNDVLVRVNGAELTKGEVERQIAFRIALAKLRLAAKFDAQREAKMRYDMRRTSDQQFIMQELMRAYALSNGVTVTEADRGPMREKLVKTYAKGGNYRKLVKSLSQENKAILGEGVDRELWVQKGREKLTADNMKPVEDAEVAKRREGFVKYNERANAVLAKAWLDATNVWKRATDGYPFEKLVELYENGDVEHASAEAEWVDIKASDYKDDKELFRVLTKTPEGAIPPPFEGDNGVMVVKMLKVTPANPSEGQPEALYRLAKIHFELPEIWTVQSDAELRTDLEAIHRKEAFAKGIKALVDASKIDYPCGTNLFPRVSRRRSPMPAEVQRRLPKGMKLPE